MNVEHLKKFTLISPVPAILVGILLLTLGRKLFWLFVAAIGFLVGTEFAAPFLPAGSGWLVAVGLVLGLVGAVLALVVQKFAVAAAGFLAGGYFLMTALVAWAPQDSAYGWITFLIGGFVGAMLMIFVFNWALIVFSSISGAHLIVHAFPGAQDMATGIFAGLVVVGCVVQGRALTARTTREV